MSATLTNGRSRKSLAEQIDRLDSMLDGLSDGLNEAVAEAVKQAVRGVLTEVLTSPELLARLQPAPVMAVPEMPRPSRWLARAWDRVRSAFGWAAEQAQACQMRAVQACGRGCERVVEGGRRFRARSVQLLVAGGRALVRARWILGPMLAAGVLAGLTGVAAYHMGPWIAAGVSGAGGLGTALGTPVSSSWLRRVWPWRATTE